MLGTGAGRSTMFIIAGWATIPGSTCGTFVRVILLCITVQLVLLYYYCTCFFLQCWFGNYCIILLPAVSVDTYPFDM